MKTDTPQTRRWFWLPICAGVVFTLLAVASAYKETPTVDEFAHVPAGVVHWRGGQFDLYRNNPPLGKMWVALPVAFSSSVKVPEFSGDGVGWEPWVYADLFQRENFDHYLSLMSRARLMTIPLVLVAGWLVYLWGNSLFGPFAASVSATLFLLSPTLLAHGHLATVDVASMTTFFAAVLTLRWACAAPSWRRNLVAGAVLGLALAIKFSALLLIPLAPLLMVVLYHRSAEEKRQQVALRLLKQLAIYAVAAWLTLSATMGFSGIWTPVGKVDARSDAVRKLVDALPAQMPILLPLEYVRGVDALQWDIQTGTFAGYLHGQWSSTGWRSYYFIAYLIKETEPVVILTVLSLLAVLAVKTPWRQVVALWAAPGLFMLAAAMSTLCLGIRYILPVFPFIFVSMGACFAWGEARLLRSQPQTDNSAQGRRRSAPQRKWDPRYWIAGPLVGYQLLLVIAVFPGYLSYFNGFVGGSKHGYKWLIDSNLDWGQDLYRVPELAARYGVDPVQLMYFGHALPELYGIRYAAMADPPEPGVYVVSTNYWQGMKYAQLSPDGELDYRVNSADWMRRLIPTELAGSLVVFDLRESLLATNPTATNSFNLGLMFLRRGDLQRAQVLMQQVLRDEPEWAAAHYYLGLMLTSQGQVSPGLDSFRKAIELEPSWPEPMNNLAWYLATSPDPAIRNGEEAVKWATEASRLRGDQQVEYLDTLAAALAETGDFPGAIAVCQQGIQQAQKLKRTDLVENLQTSLARYEAGEPLRDYSGPRGE